MSDRSLACEFSSDRNGPIPRVSDRIHVPSMRRGSLHAGVLRRRPIRRGWIKTPIDTTSLKAYVEALAPGTPWLFPSAAAKSRHTVDIRKPFIKAVVAAGLDPARLHRNYTKDKGLTTLARVSP